MIQPEDYRRWQCLWDQVTLLIARLELFENFKISTVDSLKQIKALVYDIEAAQSFMRSTSEKDSDISSPRIIELQEKLSLILANLEIAARKLKEIPGAPGPLSLDRLKGFRQQLINGKEELTSVVTAAFERLKFH